MARTLKVTKTKQARWLGRYLEKKTIERRQHEIRKRSSQESMDDENALRTMVALDAMEQGHPDAHKLLIGVPSTIRVLGLSNTITFSAKIVGASLDCSRLQISSDDGSWNAWWFHRRLDGSYVATGRTPEALSVLDIQLLIGER